jgi:hypothetical protein
MKTITQQVGDELVLEIQKSKEGKPISHTEDGVVVFFKRAGQFLPIGSSFYCTVIDVKEKCILVEPIVKAHTAVEVLNMKMKALATPKPEKTRKTNVTRTYLFMSNVQRRASEN